MITSLRAFDTGAPWPPPGEAKRLQRYRDNRLLFKGEHDSVFENAHRELRPELKVAQHFVLNLHKRLSTHWADLVVNEPPSYTVEANQEALDAIVEGSSLSDRAREAVIDCSRFGNGILKCWLENGQPQIDVQQPDYWFPVVSESNTKRITAHVLAWTVKRQEEGRELEYLRIEIHERGRIIHRAYHAGGKAIGAPADLLAVAPELSGRIDANGAETTNVDAFLVEAFAALSTSDGVIGPDDYADLDSLIIEMEARLAQMSRILDKHADPGMYGPEGALEFDHETQSWQFRKAGYIPLEKEDSPPGYLTWDGDLTSALAEFNLLMEQVFLYAETSPAGLGLPSRAGEISSGFQFRLAMDPDVKKAARIRGALDAALKRILVTASALTGGALEDISINWKPFILRDATETAQIIQWLLPAGAMSRYTAVEMQHPDWSEGDIMAELDRIADDEAASAALSPGLAPPAALMGPPDEPNADAG